MLRRTLLSWGVTLSLLGLLASNALTATYAAAAPVCKRRHPRRQRLSRSTPSIHPSRAAEPS